MLFVDSFVRLFKDYKVSVYKEKLEGNELYHAFLHVFRNSEFDKHASLENINEDEMALLTFNKMKELILNNSGALKSAIKKAKKNNMAPLTGIINDMLKPVEDYIDKSPNKANAEVAKGMIKQFKTNMEGLKDIEVHPTWHNRTGRVFFALVAAVCAIVLIASICCIFKDTKFMQNVIQHLPKTSKIDKLDEVIKTGMDWAVTNHDKIPSTTKIAAGSAMMFAASSTLARAMTLSINSKQLDFLDDIINGVTTKKVTIVK